MGQKDIENTRLVTFSVFGTKRTSVCSTWLEGDDNDVLDCTRSIFVQLIIVRCDFYILWGIKIIIKKITRKKNEKKYWNICRELEMRNIKLNTQPQKSVGRLLTVQMKSEWSLYYSKLRFQTRKTFQSESEKVESLHSVVTWLQEFPG